MIRAGGDDLNFAAHRINRSGGMEGYQYVNQLKPPGGIASSKECSREAVSVGSSLYENPILAKDSHIPYRGR